MLQHTKVGKVEGWRRSVRAWMMSGSVGGGSGGRWSASVSYRCTWQKPWLTLSTERNNARVTVPRGEVRIEADLWGEVVQNDPL